MIQICRFWNLSIASVLALTVSNVLLTVRLLHSVDCPYVALDEVITAIPKVPPLTQAPCVDYVLLDTTANATASNRPVFAALNLKLGRWDTRRLYKIFDFVVVGDKYTDLTEQYNVCLATQSSLERLSSLVHVAAQWTGPISVAVYAAGNDELDLLQLYISYLRKCFWEIKDRASFHLAYPKDRPPKTVKELLGIDFSGYDCAKPEATLKELLKHRSTETTKWRLKNAYPQNHLRNVARKGCQSGHVFLTDVDIIPSINFTEHLDKFLRTAKCGSMCAYVIPTYELDIRVRFPHDKSDLIRLARKGLARPFHHKVFIYNQFATNFTRWEADMKGNAVTHISYNVTNFEFFYEPFYVAPDTVPPHDERFLGYGFTRNTQVYEMFVAGYQFQVLSPIFTCHWGLQNKKSRPAWRERQNNLNRKQFEVFKREVFARYHKDPLKMVLPKKTARLAARIGTHK